MKPARVELHIGRVVWHGSGAPDRPALEAALQTALACALESQAPRGDPGAAGRMAAAVVPELLARFEDAVAPPWVPQPRAGVENLP